MAKNKNKVAEALKKILESEPDILLRGEELSSKMQTLNLGGDFMAIKKALSYKIGEILLDVDKDDAAATEQAEENLHKILQANNMPEERIDFVVAAFAYALGWKKEEAADHIASELSLGGISIGDSLLDVQKLLGQANEQKTTDGITALEYDSVSVWLKNDAVTAVGSYSADAKTIRSIHEGSSLQDVLNAYGDKYSPSTRENCAVYDYYMIGERHKGYLRFVVNPHNTVELIYVSEAEDALITAPAPTPEPPDPAAPNKADAALPSAPTVSSMLDKMKNSIPTSVIDTVKSKVPNNAVETVKNIPTNVIETVQNNLPDNAIETVKNIPTNVIETVQSNLPDNAIETVKNIPTNVIETVQNNLPDNAVETVKNIPTNVIETVQNNLPNNAVETVKNLPNSITKTVQNNLPDTVQTNVPSNVEAENVDNDDVSLSKTKVALKLMLKDKFFRFDGRIGRKQFILRLIIINLAQLPFWIIFPIGFIASLIAVYSGIALEVRRLHDLNRPWQWVLALFIPIVGFAILIYLLCFKGTDGDNDYGPDPLKEKSSF
jgi:uncharacterized membrane protein YhaH (DUF805 family)/putative heme iron utilization protein